MTNNLIFKENEPLAKHTTLRVGGPAKFFVEIKSEAEIMEALDFAKNNQLPFFILGGGSNTLANDAGFNGLVIKIQNNELEINGEEVNVGAGYITALAARKIGEAGLTGFEWAVTLPGTIGGAVFGNAGCFNGEMKDVLESVRILEVPSSKFQVPKKSQIVELKNEECKFSYRNSVFKKMSNIVILSVTLRLSEGDKDKIKALMQTYLDMRKTKQPLDAPSAGCMFKNYEIAAGEQFKFVVPDNFLKNSKIPAGWLVEQAGCKNLVCGNARISDKHGNFLLNSGKATAKEVKDLISEVQIQVKNKFGLDLEMEVRTM